MLANLIKIAMDNGVSGHELVIWALTTHAVIFLMCAVALNFAFGFSALTVFWIYLIVLAVRIIGNLAFGFILYLSVCDKK